MRQALSIAQQQPEKHYRDIIDNTCGIVFLGTPHHGFALAQWAEKLAKAMGLLKQSNTQLLAVLKSDSEVLARIQNDFHTMIRSRNLERLRPIEITCFYEELPVAGIGIVSQGTKSIIIMLILYSLQDCALSISNPTGLYIDRNT